MEILFLVIGIVAGAVAGFLLLRYVANGHYQKRIKEAEKEADVIKEKKMLEVKEKFLSRKNDFDNEIQQRNHQLLQKENKLKQREIGLNQRQEEMTRKKAEQESQRQRLEQAQTALQSQKEELEKMKLQERDKLEELSGLSAEEAKSRLVESLKDEAKTDAQSYINDIMDDAKLTATKEAKKIVIQTIQRVAT